MNAIMSKIDEYSVTDDTLLEVPDGVPETLPEDLPREYETERLRLVATETDTLGFEDWIPECPSLWWDVYSKEDGEQIGDLGVYYDYASKLIWVDNVSILTREGNDLNKGYGVEMYKAIPTMLLPDGRTPEEAGFVFVTDEHSPEAERVWQSLERRGLVQNVGARAYMWTGGK
ncbi:MAG: hypothetical protein WBP22_00705 [Candidatus Saccharimonas sp.]